MEDSVRWRRAEAMARAASTPMAPSRQASAHVGQVAQRPPEAHPALGGTARHPTARGDPRRRRLGPVGRPLLARLEGGRRLGDEGLEARDKPVQLLDGRAVAVVRRARRHQCIERLGEVLQLHGSMEARGCHTSRAANFRAHNAGARRPFFGQSRWRGCRRNRSGSAGA